MVRALFMVGCLLLAALGVAVPASAISMASTEASSSACLWTGLHPPSVGVDPRACRKAVWAIFCVVVYTIAPYVYCNDPLDEGT